MPPWLFWIVLGLVAGALAKYLVPGRDPSGCIVTTVLGIAGSFVGGAIGAAAGWGRVSGGTLDLRTVGLATLGAVVVLVAGRLVHRATAGAGRGRPAPPRDRP